jgi:RHS repeat-associated protein
VDVVTGANVDDFLDYELPGPLPFSWRRYYDSSLSPDEGPLGRGFRHEYQRELRRVSGGLAYLTPEGEVVEFPHLGPEEDAANDGLLLRHLGDGRYALLEAGQPTMVFNLGVAEASAPLQRLTWGAHWLDFQYDAAGNLRAVQASTGHLIQFSVDGRRHITAVALRAPDSPHLRLLATYTYDGRGRLTQWQDALGQRSDYQYDALHRMTRKQDRRGYAYHYRYDSDNRCTHTYGDDGLYDVRLAYFPDARHTRVTFADGATSTYYYDENGTLSEIVDPYGESTIFKTGEGGRVEEQVDPAGNVTRLLYDSWGGHTVRVDPLGYVTPPLHLEPHPPNPLAYTLPKTALQWEFGKLLEGASITALAPEDPILAEFPTELTEALLFRASPNTDSVLSGREGNGRRPPEPTVRRTQDALGRLLEEVDEQGHVQRWRYDPNGNVLSHQDRDGAVYRSEYFSWNLKGREIDPLGHANTYKYSLREEITQAVDAGGTISEYVYDYNDRLIEVHRHGRLKERYRYNAAGSLIEKLDGQGRPLLSFDVGPGNLHSVRRLASGENHYFNYDSRGRFTQAATDTFRVTFQHDAAGRLVKDQRDGLGIVHEFAGPQQLTTSYFDRFALHCRVDPSGVRIITDPTGAEHRLQISRSGLIARALANGSLEFSQYDGNGRCLGKFGTRRGEDAAADRWHRAYAYSAEGDLLTVADRRHGITRYRYDAAHRLICETGPDGASRDFRHDAAGNLLRQPGLAEVVMAEGNRLQAANGDAFIYNDRNHIRHRQGRSGVTRYTYNALDMLVGCEINGEPWRADYDPLCRRISKSWRGQTSAFYWDDFRLMAEVRHDGAVRLYLYLDEAALVPFMWVEYESLEAAPESGRRYFLFTNQIGVPLQVEDERGKIVWSAQIDPFGQAQVSAESTLEMPLRFPGHYYDPETGLHYNRFRYYSPELGRYLQSDPLGIAGGINLYRYPANPLVGVDVDGLHPDTASPNRNTPNNPKAGVGESAKAQPKVSGDVPQEATSVAREGAADRARQVHSVLDPRAQRARTTAVTETREGVRVISSSERRLTPAQRAQLRANEVEGVGLGHAEVTGVDAARQMGLSPTGTAASRPICPSCTRTLEKEGVRALSPLR